MPSICPRHYLQHNVPVAATVTLRRGCLHLELLALSLNAWAKTQRDYGTPTAAEADVILASVTALPLDMQIRAIAMIYGMNPEELASDNAGASEPYERKSTGVGGFTERGVPDDYDVAAGSVIGYRGWRITRSPEDIVSLVGAYGSIWPYPTGVGHRYTATCEKRRCKSVPNEDNCGCGFWAYWEPSDSTYEYNFIGAIEGSGKVILGDNGFRSQHAVIRGFAPAYRLMPPHNVLSWYRAPVYDNVTALVNAIGTDSVYSPIARDLSAFTFVPQRVLETYLVTLNRVMDITTKCTPRPAHYQQPWMHAYAPQPEDRHSVTALNREVSLVKTALSSQRQHTAKLT